MHVVENSFEMNNYNKKKNNLTELYSQYFQHVNICGKGKSKLVHYLVLGSPLSLPDIGGDNSLCLLSQPGVGTELGDK